MGRMHRSADNLNHLLKQAYRHRAVAADPAVDSRALMRRIRHLEASTKAASPGMLLDSLFWRMAPAAGALIAILALVAVNLDFAPDAAWSLFSYENDAADMVATLLL